MLILPYTKEEKAFIAENGWLTRIAFGTAYNNGICEMHNSLEQVFYFNSDEEVVIKQVKNYQ